MRDLQPHLTLQVRYLDPNITRLQKIDKGDLIDVRVSSIKLNSTPVKILPNKSITYKAGDVLFVGLGFAMKMPDGYKANLYPRSSTFINYGLILTNSVGQIDNSYQGNDDEWKIMMYALRDGSISYNDRIAQFEVVRAMPHDLDILEVSTLVAPSRGGYGSTGVK